MPATIVSVCVAIVTLACFTGCGPQTRIDQIIYVGRDATIDDIGVSWDGTSQWFDVSNGAILIRISILPSSLSDGIYEMTTLVTGTGESSVDLYAVEFSIKSGQSMMSQDITLEPLRRSTATTGEASRSSATASRMQTYRFALNHIDNDNKKNLALHIKVSYYSGQATEELSATINLYQAEVNIPVSSV